MKILSRIGVLGGTFNPVHNAHIMMAERALSDFGLDKVLFIPDGKPPYKKESREYDISDRDRLNMVNLAAAENADFEVSEREISKKSFSYTSDTLAGLKYDHPDTSLFFIMGSDSFLYLEKWHRPDIIMKNASICVFERNADIDQINLMNEECIDTFLTGEEIHEKVLEKKELFEKKYGADIMLSEYRPPYISSSMIRRMVSSGKDISLMVPADVSQYIADHRLYVRH